MNRINHEETIEGVNVVSTGETGGSKFLREDGDGTCSWQTVSGASGDLTGVTSVINGSFTKLGTAADQEYIDFSSSDQVNTKVNDTTRLCVKNTN